MKKSTAICLLSIGSSQPSCMITSTDTKSIINFAKQHSLGIVYKNNLNATKQIEAITDFLLNNVDETKINTRYSAIDTATYSNYIDYWVKNDFKWNIDKFIKNQVSLCTENSIINACNNILKSTNGISSDINEIKSKITHVITHIDAPLVMPPMANTIIHELDLLPTCRTISLANHGCGGGNVAIELSKNICESSPNAIVLCLCYQTATTYLDWFNQLPETENQSELRAHYIGNMLFGDAFVGFLMGKPDISKIDSSKYPLFQVNETSHHLLPQYTSYIANLGGLRQKKTENRIGGFYMDSSLPEEIFSSLISSKFDFETVLRKHLNVNGTGNDLNDADYSFHAGGKTILESIEMMMKLKGLKYTHERMRNAYDILSMYGNVGACTSLLVLDKTIRNTNKLNICHIGIAPGLSIYTHGFTQFQY